MRDLFKILIAAVVVWTSFFVSPPPAQASWATIIEKVGKGAKLSFSRLKPNRATGEKGGLLVNVLDDSGKVVSSTLLEKSSKEALQRLSPNSIKQTVAQAGAQNATRPGMKHILGSTIMRFPMEAFSFFLAIGAVTSAQLIFDYSNNPVAMEQHLEAQKDPIGHIGFLAFMIANGVVSEPLMAAMESKRLRHFVPYMGMSVGMIASNIVHEVGHFPYLLQCAKESMGFKPAGQEPDACEKAYQAWIEYDMTDTLHEWAPGLISMLTSVIVSGAITAGLQWTTSQILRVTAIEIATLFVPGGIVVKGARFIWKIAQFALFVGADMVIHHYVYSPYQNFVQSIDLKGEEAKALHYLLRSQRTNFQSNLPESCWSAKKHEREDCGQDLLLTLLNLQDGLHKWRQFNMQDVIMSHSNWSRFLTDLSLQYRSAKSFYRHFVSELWQKNHGPYKNYERVIDRTFPMNGITPEGLNPDAIGAFLDDLESIETMQLQTVQKTHQSFRALLNNNHALVRGITTQEKALFVEILNKLQSLDPVKIGQAADQINAVLGIPVRRQRHSEAMKTLTLQLRNSLGQPRPLWEPGVGYILYYSIHPTYRNENPIPFSKSTLTLSTPTLEESLLTSMALGPDLDKGHSIIRNKSGFKAIFSAPKISKHQSIRTNPGLAISAGAPGAGYSSTPFETVFNSPVYTINNNGQKEGFRSIYDYLRRGNIRSSVLNANQNSFTQWWEQKPETAYVEAWIDYEHKYQDIIANLIKKIWNPSGDSFFNTGDVANSIATAMEQERKLYLLVLGELFKSAYKTTHRQEVHPQLFSREYMAPKIEKYSRPLRSEDVEFYMAPSLFETLRNSFSLSLHNHYKSYPKSPLAANVPVDNGKNLNFQDLVIRNFRQIEHLLKQLKVVRAKHKTTQEAKEITLSTVTNQQFKDAKVNLDQTLNIVAGLMGVQMSQIETDSENNTEQIVQLSPYQKALAQFLLSALQKQAEEMVNLGQIANSVSYREQHGTGEYANLRCSLERNGQGNGLSRMSRFIESCVPYQVAP